MTSAAPHIFIIEGRFYDDIADHLLSGTKTALVKIGATYDVFTVPGALEIPAAITIAADSGKYDAFIALGCVIRGETAHYDIVAGESARAIMDLTINDGLPIGNAILTTETKDQAMTRADPAQKNKGQDAVNAVMALLNLREQLKP